MSIRVTISVFVSVIFMNCTYGTDCPDSFYPEAEKTHLIKRLGISTRSFFGMPPRGAFYKASTINTDDARLVDLKVQNGEDSFMVQAFDASGDLLGEHIMGNPLAMERWDALRRALFIVHENGRESEINEIRITKTSSKSQRFYHEIGELLNGQPRLNANDLNKLARKL